MAVYAVTSSQVLNTSDVFVCAIVALLYILVLLLHLVDSHIQKQPSGMTEPAGLYSHDRSVSLFVRVCSSGVGYTVLFA